MDRVGGEKTEGHQNWAPSKVWPNCQPRGAALLLVTVRPSLAVTWKESAWPSRNALLCQFCPQFLDMGCHPVREPRMETDRTSPAPATLVTSTRLK